jgi:hypothetical protein
MTTGASDDSDPSSIDMLTIVLKHDSDDLPQANTEYLLRTAFEVRDGSDSSHQASGPRVGIKGSSRLSEFALMEL